MSKQIQTEVRFALTQAKKDKMLYSLEGILVGVSALIFMFFLGTTAFGQNYQVTYELLTGIVLGWAVLHILYLFWKMGQKSLLIKKLEKEIGK